MRKNSGGELQHDLWEKCVPGAEVDVKRMVTNGTKV